MNKLPYLVAEINAALEIYLSGRTGQQYNRTAFIICDDYAELASKLFLLTDNAEWTDKGKGKPFKNFKEVTAEVRGLFQETRAADYDAVDTILNDIEARRERRNEFFHSTSLLDLNLHARDCVEAFCSLLDYGRLLFPHDTADPGSGWDVAASTARNMETCEVIVRLDMMSYSDPSIGTKVNEVLAKWPRLGAKPEKKGCEVAHYGDDMHLRLAIRNGGNGLRDRLRALL